MILTHIRDFHARSRFAHSTIPEEKWGTTRSLGGGWVGLFWSKNKRGGGRTPLLDPALIENVQSTK